MTTDTGGSLDMKERPRSESRGVSVMDEPDLSAEALSGVGVLHGQGGDAVLQESAKLAEISRERRRQAKKDAEAEVVFELQDLSVTYKGSYAVQGVNMSIRKNEI